MPNKVFFVSGIGTNVGKTVVSAILTEALEADYWKPLQSGDLHNTDSHKVKKLISNMQSKIHPEAVLLKDALSPHASAENENRTINPNELTIPKTKNHLIIEGAGGLMVPINRKFMMVDLIQQLQTQVILVSRHYLGSINHTLLSISILKQRQIPVKGIIFVGNENQSTESVILEYSGVANLGRIAEARDIDRSFVLKYKKHFYEQLS